MKTRAIFLIMSASMLLASCYPTLPTNRNVQSGRSHVSGFDFRPYLNEGFEVSPYDLKGDAEILGEIRVQTDPEIIVCRWDTTYRRYLQKGYIEKIGVVQYSNVQTSVLYMVEPIVEGKSLEKLVTIAKQMGGDGLASFQSKYILTEYGNQFYYHTLEVSGLVYKRTEAKRPDQP
jgi:hypothetical protein